MLRSIKFLVPIAFVMASCISYAAPGDLDTSFNPPNGFVRYDSGNFDYASGVALQTDGKIVVGGDGGGNLVLLRYNPDGSPDSGFGTGGVVTDGNGDAWEAVTLQADGKIVVAGDVFAGGGWDALVLRYNPDGSLDTTGFNPPNGFVTFNSGVGNNDRGRAIALQTDGKILVAGYVIDAAGTDVLVLRYNDDGSLDTTGFNPPNGFVRFNSGVGNHDYGRAIALQTDGKILVAGYVNEGGNFDVLVLRYNDDGSLDTTGFNPPNGFVRFKSGSTEWGFGVALQTDGKIVVAGYINEGATDDVLVLRYNDDGSLDTTGFNPPNGFVIYDSGNEDYGSAVALQSDGKIVVTGNSMSLADEKALVLRYSDDGSLDSGFGTGGVVTYGSDDFGDALALQTDGKIVIADTGGNGTDSDVIVVRFLGDAGGSANPPLVGGGGGGGGCFIASAAYGSGMAKEVSVLKKVRDEYLLTNELGRGFVTVYYRYSPRLADWVAKHPTIRKIVRVGLYPILGLSKWLVGENPSE